MGGEMMGSRSFVLAIAVTVAAQFSSGVAAAKQELAPPGSPPPLSAVEPWEDRLAR